MAFAVLTDKVTRGVEYECGVELMLTRVGISNYCASHHSDLSGGRGLRKSRVPSAARALRFLVFRAFAGWIPGIEWKFRQDRENRARGTCFCQASLQALFGLLAKEQVADEGDGHAVLRPVEMGGGIGHAHALAACRTNRALYRRILCCEPQIDIAHHWPVRLRESS